MADEPIPLERRRRGTPHCPICGRAVVAAFRPFCSRRCAERDLYRWLSGGYRVATDEAPDETTQSDPRPGGPDRSG